MKQVREEVGSNVGDVQKLFKEEMHQRLESERKLTDSVREVMKNINLNQNNAFEGFNARVKGMETSITQCRNDGSER